MNDEGVNMDAESHSRDSAEQDNTAQSNAAEHITEAEAAIYYASLPSRLRASIIDGFLYLGVFVLSGLLAGVIAPSNAFLRIGLVFGPVTILEPLMVSLWGGTLGYYFLNQKVTRSDSTQYLSFPAAFIRSFIKLFLGVLSLTFMLTSKQRQALHDLVVGSVVRIRNTDNIENLDLYTESVIEDEEWIYPTKTRRVLTILFYCMLSFLLLAIIVALFTTEACLNDQSCSTSDKLLEESAGFAWLSSWAILMYFGWRGYLLGGRKRRISKEGA